MEYQVLWLPKVDIAELTRLQQCTAGALGLARVGSRLGIRSRLKDAPSVAQTLKPGSVFLASGSRSTFELGPLPFGCDRLTVSKLCGQWGWKARPLHPCRTVDGTLGNMWRVQACTPPPNNVVYYHGSEIVITKVSDADQPAQHSAAQIIGNSATVQLCTKEAAPAIDPWLKNDPWAPARGLPNPTPQGDAHTSIKEVEARITQNVWDKFNAGTMEVDSNATEARFAALEQQVQSLTAHHNNRWRLPLRNLRRSPTIRLRLCRFRSPPRSTTKGITSKACSKLNCSRLKLCSPSVPVWNDGAATPLHLARVVA